MIPIQKMKFWTCQEERGLKLVRKGEGKWEEVGGEKARGDAKWERGKERGKMWHLPDEWKPHLNTRPPARAPGPAYTRDGKDRDR